jgi:hypothetical protein
MRILTFEQINESGWIDFIKRNKKYTIDDLYVSKVKSVERINEPPKNKLMLGVSFQNLDHAKDLDNLSNQYGVFRKTTDYFNKFRFGEWRVGDIWFDYGDVFDKLKDISINKLGLKLNQEVFIKTIDKNGKIEEIEPLVIYKIHNEVFKKEIEHVFTLAYKVDGSWYQATKLEIIKSTKPVSIIDEEIEDNFLEYIDSRQLIFKSKSFKLRDTSGYECKISVSLKEPEMLDQISSRLLVMSKRLANKNIDVIIKSIDLSGISFTAIQR